MTLLADLDALVSAALEVSVAEEQRLDAMRRALLRGDEPEAVRLLRRHLGLDGEDGNATGDCAPPGQHRGAGRA